MWLFRSYVNKKSTPNPTFFGGSIRLIGKGNVRIFKRGFLNPLIMQ